MNKVFLFIVCIGFSLVVAGQNRLKEIEDEFIKNNITIKQEINGVPIQTNFEPFAQVLNKSQIDFAIPIKISTRDFNDDLVFIKYNFKNPIHFNRVNFKKTVRTSLSTFDSNVDFHQSNFFQEVNFNWTRYAKILLFSRVQFYDNANFARIVVEGNADFFQTKFIENVDFYGSAFNGKLNLINSSFSRNGNFSFCNFNDDVDFSNAVFNEDLALNNSTISSKLDFTGATFSHRLDLSNSKIKGKLEFKNAVLPEYLDLSNLEEIDKEIDLSEIKTNENFKTCYVNLLNSDISKINLKYENFQLWFPFSISREEKYKLYDDLLVSLEKHGYRSSYEKLDIEYKKLVNNDNNAPFTDYFQEKWWNYGYDKGKIFNWLFWFVSFLTIINTIFLHPLMSNVYLMGFLNMDKIESRKKLHHPVLNFMLNLPLGFIYSVILLLGGLFGIGFSSSQIKTPGFLGLLYIILIGLLGINLSAFILNYIFDL